MKIQVSERARHLILRAEAGEALPDVLLQALERNRVTGGWLRGSGVLEDVELRAYTTEAGALGGAKRVAGPVQLVALEGSVGVARGEPSLGMRALLARETESGLVTMAGELVSARVVGLEVAVTVFEDATLVRQLDGAAGVWLVSPGEGTPLPDARSAPPKAPTLGGGWSEAVAASSEVQTREAPREARYRPGSPNASSPSGPAVIPQRPVKPRTDDDSPTPEAGDIVEHFAFGRAEVLKSDGERLFLKIDKDGRIKEIAVEMLKVIPLSQDGPKRRFKLERKL